MSDNPWNWFALIQGGLGDEAWDREVKITAVDFKDASVQAWGHADREGGQVVSLELRYTDQPAASLRAQLVEKEKQFQSDPTGYTDHVINSCRAEIKQRREEAATPQKQNTELAAQVERMRLWIKKEGHRNNCTKGCICGYAELIAESPSDALRNENEKKPL